MLGIAACIDVMPLWLQDRVVKQEPREYVEGFAASARDHLVVKGAHLVGGVGIDRDRLIVVAEVAGIKGPEQRALPHRKALPIGRGALSGAPGRRQRQTMVIIDKDFVR